MILKELIKFFSEKFPSKIAEEWDNVGLLFGDENREIKKVLVVLDVTLDSINCGIDKKCDLIISHHPLIFTPIKSLNYCDIFAKKIEKLAKSNIAVYSMHTNVDAAANGLNEFLLKKLGVQSFNILVKNKYENAGIGRYFDILPTKLNLYIDFIKEKLEIDKIKVFTKNLKSNIKKVAIVNGAGASYWKEAYAAKCDLLITGDVGHHDGLDAAEYGLSVVDISHFHGEKFFCKMISTLLNNFDLCVDVFEKSPFVFY